jgi:hypothetical protein
MNTNHLHIDKISLKLYLSFLKQRYSILLAIIATNFKLTFAKINLFKLDVKPLISQFDSY